MPLLSHPLIPLRFPDVGSLAEPQQKPVGRDTEWQYFTNNLLRRDIEIGTFFSFLKIITNLESLLTKGGKERKKVKPLSHV